MHFKVPKLVHIKIPLTAQLCSEVLEIKFHPDIVDYVHFHSCGNVRKAMKLIRSVEEIGRYNNLEVVSQADLDD
ncbi:hypothetical protein MASR2M64_08410 [Candidatus Cloacimonadota bacterium]